MTKQWWSTKEFEDEAVRLVATSGCTQWEVAEDLGVGLSTLVRWIGRRRDRLVGCCQTNVPRYLEGEVLLPGVIAEVRQEFIRERAERDRLV